jgi:hypothetical protein
LGRAYWEADKFACWTEKNEGMESILTTTTLTLGGNYIEVLADEADAELVFVCTVAWRSRDINV